jgi:hypothetical protein
MAVAFGDSAAQARKAKQQVGPVVGRAAAG